MLSEQTLMNAGVLVVAANAGGSTRLTVGMTGFVFNVLLIVRAPLQLFQAIQTSILPHLGGPRGARVGRGVPPGDPDHDPGDRGVRGRGGASGCSRSARS